MTQLHTTDDLLREFRENDEFRNAVRRLILTDELLNLPVLVESLQMQMQQMNGRMDGMESRMDSMETRMNDMQTQIDDLRTEMTARLDAVDARLDALEARMDDMQTQIDNLRVDMNNRMDDMQTQITGLRDSVNNMGGKLLEATLANALRPLLAREFNVRRVYAVWPKSTFVHASYADTFDSEISDAAEDGKITEDDEDRLELTDLIVRSRRKSDRSTLWFTVEASGTISDYDIRRARHSADAIAKVYDEDTLPLVYGYRISDHNREIANALGVSVYLDATD